MENRYRKGLDTPPRGKAAARRWYDRRVVALSTAVDTPAFYQLMDAFQKVWDAQDAAIAGFAKKIIPDDFHNEYRCDPWPKSSVS